MQFKSFLITLFVIGLMTTQTVEADTNKYRLMWRNDPSTSMVIGWDQASGANPVVYYDTVDHGANYSQYQFQHSPDRSVSAKGMDNKFARLSGLQPDTKYYFVIHDSEGTSSRYWFETIPADSTKPLSIVAGGDSRNNRTPRKNANRIVSKLRPDFVAFGGDFTNLNFGFQWRNWFDDWQLTIAQDGRITPIVPARGNHESSGDEISKLFDVANPDQYYALTFGGNLLRMYTLNSEISVIGTQATWLDNDLAAHQNTVDWKFAQYHKPMRPHVSSKSEQQSIRNSWGQSFYDYGLNLAIECDAHDVKRTWPIRPSYGPGNDEGFVRDDSRGTVYIGEGCWGAPLRSNDDTKSWTRNSGSFNQLKWIWVTRDTVQVRTIKTDNAQSVASVADSSRFTPPASLNVWKPSNGEVIYLTNPDLLPEVSLEHPKDGQVYNDVKGARIRAKAADSNGTISKVAFFVDDSLIATDVSAPYTAYFPFPGKGDYEITAKATNNEGLTKTTDPVSIGVAYFEQSYRVSGSNNDAEEGDNGFVNLNGRDLELTEENGDEQVIGIRFQDVRIPNNARITYAALQFTVDEASQQTTSLVIKGEANDNPAEYQGGLFNLQNISGRPVTNASVAWNPAPWDSVGTIHASADISSIVTEIINRPGWSNGNAIAFVIEGTGKRVAESYDGSPQQAPELVIQYDLGPMTLPDLGPDRSFCRGDTALLSPGSGYLDYLWNYGEASGNPLIVDSAGNYIVSVRAAPKGLNYAEDTIDVSLWPLPSPDLGQDTLIEENDTAVLHALPGMAAYQWTAPGGQALDDSTWLTTTKGAYSLQVTDSNGCTGRDTVVVDTFRVNNDTTVTDTSDTTTTSVGLPAAKEKISLTNRPNPFTSQTMVYYHLPSSRRIHLNVVNIAGKQVAELYRGRKAKGEHEVMLNAQNLETGVYFLKLQTPHKQVVRKMVLTQR